MAEDETRRHLALAVFFSVTGDACYSRHRFSNPGGNFRRNIHAIDSDDGLRNPGILSLPTGVSGQRVR